MKIWICIFLFFMVSACKSHVPKQLIFGLESGMSYSEVQEMISQDIETIVGETENYQIVKFDEEHLGVSGKAMLIFFENKLSDAGFYPKDTSRYLRNLEAEMGLRLVTNKEYLFKAVKVIKAYDYELGSIGGLFVCWGDNDISKKYQNRTWNLK